MAAKSTARTAAPRPRKCPTCKQRFRPTRRGMVYCSETCFRKAWRRKQRRLKKHPLDPTINPKLEAGTCLYCGRVFWSHAGKGAKYCKPGCRTMANRVRRAATIAAFCEYSGKSHAEALDFAELRGGVRAMQVFLTKKGLIYSESARRWVYPSDAL